MNSLTKWHNLARWKVKMKYGLWPGTGFPPRDMHTAGQVSYKAWEWKKGPSCLALIPMCHKEAVEQWLLTLSNLIRCWTKHSWKPIRMNRWLIRISNSKYPKKKGNRSFSEVIEELKTWSNRNRKTVKWDGKSEHKTYFSQNSLLSLFSYFLDLSQEYLCDQNSTHQDY